MNRVEPTGSPLLVFPETWEVPSSSCRDYSVPALQSATVMVASGKLPLSEPRDVQSAKTTECPSRTEAQNAHAIGWLFDKPTAACFSGVL